MTKKELQKLIKEEKQRLEEIDLMMAGIGFLLSFLLGMLPSLGIGIAAKYGGDGAGLKTIATRMWKKHRKDRKMKQIIAKLKGDPDLMPYLKNWKKRGLRKVLATKLDSDELKYLNSITRNHLSENTTMTKKELQQLIKEEITKQSRSKYIKLRDVLNENRKQTKLEKEIQRYIKNGSKGDLNLAGEPISELPDNLKQVDGNLLLFNTKIKSLPNNLTVGGNLDVRKTKIRSLPDNLKVRGKLFAGGSSIKSLGNNLTAGGELELNMTPIRSLPNNLNVGGTLDLIGTNIKSLPNNLTVNGSLDLRHTPLAKQYTKEQIKTIITQKGGNIDGRIIA